MLRAIPEAWQPRLDAFAEWLAPRLPAVVLAFFAAQAVIRMVLSGNLEVDEAQFVGSTGFELGFPGSHPPLYNWLITLAYDGTGGSWVAAAALVKNALLAGHFILAWDLLRRLKADPMAGLMAAAALALLPQVIWQGQVTLAHSVAVGFATLATLHATALWLTRRSVAAALWLGVAVAIGTLSKYNFLLFLGVLGLALASLAPLRPRLDRRTAVLAAATALALILPHAIWALANFGETSARVAKLYSERNQVVGFDLPVLGIDGLASLGLAVLAWGAPLAVVWGLLYWGSHRTDPGAGGTATGWEFSADFARLCGRTALFGVGALALVVLLADMHKVHERYLTPLLMPAVIWLALRFPLEKASPARGLMAGLAAVLFLASMIAIPATVAFGPSRLAYPYPAIADAIAGTDVVPLDIAASRQDLAANVALLLPDGRQWQGASDRPVVVIWRRGPHPPSAIVAALGEDYRRSGETETETFAYDNWSGREQTLNWQVFQPVGD